MKSAIEQDVFPRLQKIFYKLFGVSESKLTPETSAADLKGWDSLHQIALIVEIEKEFNIKIDNHTALKLTSLKHIMELLGGYPGRPQANNEMAGPIVLLDRMSAVVPGATDVFSTLLQSGQIKNSGPGAYRVNGDLLKLFGKLDRRISELAQELNAEEAEFPVTLSAQDTSLLFPKGVPDTVVFLNDKVTCRHAICTPSYVELKGNTVPGSWNRTVTSLGRVFRNEAEYSGLERLHEYSMREIIFYGSAEHVEKSLQRCLQWCEDFLIRLNLNGNIVTATDPFFVSDKEAYQNYQLNKKSKIEVQLVNPETKKSVAVISLNSHGHYFAKNFEIKFEQGQFISTGCIGFGYERLLSLILSQHGTNPQSWNRDLQKFFEI